MYVNLKHLVYIFICTKFQLEYTPSSYGNSHTFKDHILHIWMYFRKSANDGDEYYLIVACHQKVYYGLLRVILKENRSNILTIMRTPSEYCKNYQKQSCTVWMGNRHVRVVTYVPLTVKFLISDRKMQCFVTEACSGSRHLLLLLLLLCRSGLPRIIFF